MPSDNMNKVMMGTFQNDHVNYLQHRKQIQDYLQTLAKRQERRQQYNIYHTKAAKMKLSMTTQ